MKSGSFVFATMSHDHHMGAPAMVMRRAGTQHMMEVTDATRRDVDLHRTLDYQNSMHITWVSQYLYPIAVKHRKESPSDKRT